MDKTPWTIRFYKSRDGGDPVTEFILGLPPKDRAKVLWSIRLLESEGIRIREPHSKALEKNLFELRVIHGNNIQRVFYYLFDYLCIAARVRQKNPENTRQRNRNGKKAPG